MSSVAFHHGKPSASRLAPSIYEALGIDANGSALSSNGSAGKRIRSIETQARPMIRQQARQRLEVLIPELLALPRGELSTGDSDLGGVLSTAQKMRQQGKFLEAITTLEQALRSNRQAIFLLLELAENCKTLNQRDLARKIFEYIFSFSPGNVQVVQRFVSMLLGIRQFREATAFLQGILQEYPNHKVATDLLRQIRTEPKSKKTRH